jgi:hypothetical protein
MDNKVSITYSIRDDEWTRTAALRWQEDVFPTYDCFYGLVSFRVGDREILGTSQFDISIGDLAVGLAGIVGELRTGPCGILKFQQSDDMLEISFHAKADTVVISHNLTPGDSWICDRGDLEIAIVNFVTAFANEASGRVSDLFSWRDMEILRYFSAQHTKA